MSTPQPGWYADPGAPGMLRWWDGSRWTEHARPVPRAPQAAREADRTGGPEERAGFGKRLLAYLCDTVFTSILTVVLTIRAQVEVQDEVAHLQERMDRRVARGRDPRVGEFFDDVLQVYADQALWLFVVPAALVLVAHVVFLRWRSATPGKLIVGLRVRRLDGGRIGWSHVLVRVVAQFGVVYALYGLAAAAGAGGTFLLLALAASAWSVVDPLVAAGRSRRALHDVIAETQVVVSRR